MAKRKNKNKARSLVGRAGTHHETSPMGHATRTKTRSEKRQARKGGRKRRGNKRAARLEGAA
jgi:hypothetical protein